MRALTIDDMELLDRVRTGNNKLYKAWKQIQEFSEDKDKFNELSAVWDGKVQELKKLCGRLKFVFDDCLYIQDGKKTRTCWGTMEDPTLWCIVCPAESRRYWEDELFERKKIAELKCWTCSGTDFWVRKDGQRICNKCHPNPQGK